MTSGFLRRVVKIRGGIVRVGKVLRPRRGKPTADEVDVCIGEVVVVSLDADGFPLLFSAGVVYSPKGGTPIEGAPPDIGDAVGMMMLVREVQP